MVMAELDYPLIMRRLTDEEGGGYLIEFPDLPGCISDGETPEEALRNGLDALRCWLEAMREAGRAVPPPPQGMSYLPLPTGVRSWIEHEAEASGMSTEIFLLMALSIGIARLSPGDQEPDEESRRNAKLMEELQKIGIR